MKRVLNAGALNRALGRYRALGETIGFVPTMGDLHRGHLSLVACARRENDRVVVSVFVNPTQFGPEEDYKRYPRKMAHDSKLCRKAGVDILFTPSVKQMYPEGFQTTVEVEKLSKYLCGADRPGHFKGVATVVAKLFNLVRPDRAYFGLKDYQQAMIVRRMARDLQILVGLKFCRLVRDADGLALSSRNRYLSVEQRKRALSIYRALMLAKKLIKNGTRRAGEVKRKMSQVLRGYVDKIHYVSIVDPVSLETTERIRGSVLLAIAARVGKTRLIDNLIIRV